MYGFNNDSLSWFRNYLHGRVQYAKVNGVTSDYRITRCGVPQGSILGPLLFVIYINDLAQCITECRLNLNADDTTLYNASPSYVDLMMSLRLELTTLTEWMLANKLTLNVKKTKFMIFGSKPKLSEIPLNTMNLYINNQIVEYVHSFKYLGVIFKT